MSSKQSSETPLSKAAKERSSQVVERLNRTMKLIEHEIDALAGIYPLNGGRLSQAELCRRAGVSKMTLQSPTHRDSTRKKVDEWLKRVLVRSTTGRRSVRKAVTERAEFWKQQHSVLATAKHIEALQLAQLKDQLAAANAKIKALESSNEELRTRLSKSSSANVVPFARKGSV